MPTFELASDSETLEDIPSSDVGSSVQLAVTGGANKIYLEKENGVWKMVVDNS